MGLPTAAIQAGLITRYRGDSALQGLLVGSVSPNWNIFDMGAVPTRQPFPYVAVYPITSMAGAAMTMVLPAVDTWVQVSIYTQNDGVIMARGFNQARKIAQRIYTLTDRQMLDLAASGFSNFFVLFEHEQELQEPDGLTQQIAHRYKFMTQG